jgi:hypothetical protein
MTAVIKNDYLPIDFTEVFQEGVPYEAAYATIRLVSNGGVLELPVGDVEFSECSSPPPKKRKQKKADKFQLPIFG